MPTLSDSPEDLAWVRQFVGSEKTISDDDLDAVYDTPGVGTREEVVRRVVNTRLADYEARPDRIDIPGQYGQSTGVAMRSLQERLKGLDDLGVSVDPSATEVTMVAPCPKRR